MKIWIAIIVLVLVDSIGTLLIAQGMKQVGEISSLQPRRLLRMGRRIVTNRFLWLGFVFQTSTFFLFLTLLSWANVSLVIPMAASGYVINILGAQFLLKERVTKERWIGTLLICVGVALVSLNSGAQ
jgi:drug/metabolite transporter (DMT)-like permease